VRFLPKQGACSRTQAFELIRAGRVLINGKAVIDPNREVSVSDRIVVDGKPLFRKIKSRYILFHKPAGYITTRRDEKGRKTVYDLLGDTGGWVFPVGRLDKDSEGLLLFTNDTAFGDFLTDPANKIKRVYAVTVEGQFSDTHARKAVAGVDIGRGERSRPVSVKIITVSGRKTDLEITLLEGKNREIRRLCEKLGTPVLSLRRTAYGPFRLGTLAPGKWRALDERFCVDLYGSRKYY